VIGVAADHRLISYDAWAAADVLSWVDSARTALHWAGLDAVPDDPSVLDSWHADPDVAASLLLCGHRLVGYGEVWRDGQEGEIARVIVAPADRGHGVGRVLVSALATQARAAGLSPVWIRLHEDNDAALACYAAAGFRRADPAGEAEFNAGQPKRYIWMRADG
jgi:ribosomal protein S18 acetylase RimI-like enzyme